MVMLAVKRSCVSIGKAKDQGCDPNIRSHATLVAVPGLCRSKRVDSRQSLREFARASGECRFHRHRSLLVDAFRSLEIFRRMGPTLRPLQKDGIGGPAFLVRRGLGGSGHEQYLMTFSQDIYIFEPADTSNLA